MGLPIDIRNLRKAALLSQESFAKELGVSFSTVNRWEMGKSRPSYAALKKLKNFSEKHGLTFTIELKD